MATLYTRYKILNIREDKGMSRRISVNRVLLELYRVYIITMGAKMARLEVKKKSEEIERTIDVKLFSNILRG